MDAFPRRAQRQKGARSGFSASRCRLRAPRAPSARQLPPVPHVAPQQQAIENLRSITPLPPIPRTIATNANALRVPIHKE